MLIVVSLSLTVPHPRPALPQALFTVADLWTPSVSLRASCALLLQLLDTVSLMAHTEPRHLLSLPSLAPAQSRRRVLKPLPDSYISALKASFAPLKLARHRRVRSLTRTDSLPEQHLLRGIVQNPLVPPHRPDDQGPGAPFGHYGVMVRVLPHVMLRSRSPGPGWEFGERAIGYRRASARSLAGRDIDFHPTKAALEKASAGIGLALQKHAEAKAERAAARAAQRAAAAARAAAGANSAEASAAVRGLGADPMGASSLSTSGSASAGIGLSPASSGDGVLFHRLPSEPVDGSAFGPLPTGAASAENSGVRATPRFYQHSSDVSDGRSGSLRRPSASAALASPGGTRLVAGLFTPPGSALLLPGSRRESRAPSLSGAGEFRGDLAAALADHEMAMRTAAAAEYGGGSRRSSRPTTPLASPGGLYAAAAAGIPTEWPGQGAITPGSRRVSGAGADYAGLVFAPGDTDGISGSVGGGDRRTSLTAAEVQRLRLLQQEQRRASRASPFGPGGDDAASQTSSAARERRRSSSAASAAILQLLQQQQQAAREDALAADPAEQTRRAVAKALAGVLPRASGAGDAGDILRDLEASSSKGMPGAFVSDSFSACCISV